MQIGKRLKDLRKKLKLTQKELAKKIKESVDYTYIGKIERGEQNPSLNILERIADSFNLKVEYFFSESPVEMFLGSEKENNLKRNELLNLVYTFDKEERDFIINIMNFIKRHKNSSDSLPRIPRAAEKRTKYKK